MNPTRGDEIGKVRTAVVISPNGLGKLSLHVIVPVTEWRPGFAAYPWFARLTPSRTNGLTKESGVDALQVRSVSRDRFVKKVGDIPPAKLQEICLAVALCIGLDPVTGEA